MLSLRGSFQSVGQANTKQDDIKCQQCRLQPIRNVTSCMNIDRSFANCVMPLNLCSKTSSHILFYSYMQKNFITLLNLKAISMRSKSHLFLSPGFILRHNIILNMKNVLYVFSTQLLLCKALSSLVTQACLLSSLPPSGG